MKWITNTAKIISQNYLTEKFYETQNFSIWQANIFLMCVRGQKLDSTCKSFYNESGTDDKFWVIQHKNKLGLELCQAQVWLEFEV